MKCVHIYIQHLICTTHDYTHTIMVRTTHISRSKSIRHNKNRHYGVASVSRLLKIIGWMRKLGEHLGLPQGLSQTSRAPLWSGTVIKACISRSSLSIWAVFQRGCLYELSIYGVATVSRIDKMIGLFCRILSLLQISFAKETYNLFDLTNCSHPIGCLYEVDHLSCLYDITAVFQHLTYISHILYSTLYISQILYMHSYMFTFMYVRTACILRSGVSIWAAFQSRTRASSFTRRRQPVSWGKYIYIYIYIYTYE